MCILDVQHPHMALLIPCIQHCIRWDLPCLVSCHVTVCHMQDLFRRRGTEQCSSENEKISESLYYIFYGERTLFFFCTFSFIIFTREERKGEGEIYR